MTSERTSTDLHAAFLNATRDHAYPPRFSKDMVDALNA